MAERKAQNKYYPPEFDWKIHGSINHFSKANPRRQTAQKTGEKPESGCTKVRFEMPFNIWCTGCENHIGMGVRYNARKAHQGKYLSTPIFEFTMKCHLCPTKIVILTDPKNAEYIIVEGARKREEGYDPKEIGVIDLATQEVTDRLATDAFYKLEHGILDVEKSYNGATSLTQLHQYNNKFSKDPFTVNQLIRKKFRTEKKLTADAKKESEAVQKRLGISVDILPSNRSDLVEAKSIDWESQIKSTATETASRPDTTTIFSKRVKRPMLTDPRKILLSNLFSKSKGDPFAVKSTKVEDVRTCATLVDYSSD